ncbi:MAG: SusC/RagA family TonB-linked outer membrane protein, partial [Bacteroidota bacterium]
DFNRSPFITIDNPLALAQGEQAEAQTYNTLGTIYGEYFFLPSLSARVKLGGNISNSRRDVWIDPISLDGQQNGGIATIITGSRSQYLLEGTLNYNDTFGKHRVNGVIGATYERFDSENFNGNGRGYTLPDLQTNAIGSGDPLQNQIGSSKNLTKLASYLGRVNYSFDEKYLVTLSMRADGSSRFGLDNRFGFFPSAAFAWNLHNEAFIGTDNLFSQLKFRASYGVIGNQSIPNYLFLTTFALNNRDVVLEGSRFTAIAPSRAASPDLQWEETNQLDIGIDFGLYNNRIRGTVEYYNRKTTDLLLPVPLPPNSGFNSRIENIGSMRNDGWELFLETFLISTNAFNWTISANLTTINNEVLDIGDAENIITGNLGFVSSASIIRPGDPLNSYYGYVVEGVWQEGDDFLATTDAVAPGDIKYQDLNGDGTINADDRQIIGKPFPDFTWGLTNTLTYKDLSLTVFIEGVHGIELLSNNLVDTYFPINFRRNKIAEPYLNRWTPSNPTNEYPSFVNPTAQGQRVVNTRTVTDASYIRLQTVRLAYNVPVTNSGFFKQLTVFATGQNLATLTDYIGVDPAANALGNNVLRIDYNTYPFARTTMLGLTLGF